MSDTKSKGTSMNGYEKLLAIFWICLALTIASVAWAIAYAMTERFRTAVDAGMVQGTVSGQNGVHWVDRVEGTKP